MKLLSFFILSALPGLIIFNPERTENCRRSGINGHVYLEKGNRMPSPDQPPALPKGIKTILYVYPLTNTSEVERQGSSAFYRSISKELVKEIETKEDGSFKIKLPPGKYSLFVKKGDLFYSNLFDEKNNIHPVEVVQGKMTEDVFKVDYAAVY
jgi:hypothetical protein